MYLKTVAVLSISLGISQPAFSATTSLQCVEPDQTFLVTFEQAGGSADVEYKLRGNLGEGQSTGTVRLTPRIATISFQRGHRSLVLGYTMNIDRQSLVWTGSMTITGTMTGMTSEPMSGGTCEVVTLPKRQNKF